jgi:MFS family permease
MRGLRLGTVVAIGPICGVVAAFTMLLTVAIPSGLLAARSFFLMGAGPILWVVSTTTLRQTVTPRDLLGRVSAINSLAYGAHPLGAAIGALVGGLLGAPACLALAALGFLLRPRSSCARQRFTSSGSRTRPDPLTHFASGRGLPLLHRGSA